MIGALLSIAFATANQPRCAPDIHRANGGVSASQYLAAAAEAMGLSHTSGRVLHYSPNTSRELPDQSDRAYPPFVQQFSTLDRWFDPVTGVERVNGPRGTGILRSTSATFRITGTSVSPAPEAHASIGTQRAFNPWAVVVDWQRDTSVRVLGQCAYLDGPRIVLARRPALGEERLYLDPRSHFPMRLLTTELHYFLGPVHDDFQYTAWSDVAPFVYYPTSSIKLTDGLGQETWTVQEHSLAQGDSVPSLVVPTDATRMPTIPPPRFGDAEPDTVRVGANTFLLVGDRFTSAMTLAHDTVFMFDAAAGEERARRDSAWVARIFPHKPVTLVLFSAVWPHMAGLRFWVASHANVVAPILARPTIDQALARRWSAHPDKYERMRAASPLRLRAVVDSLSLAGGNVRLFVLDGIGNEGILMTYVGADRFLWASDRIQDINAPSLYVAELVASVAHAKIDPEWTAGPHTGRVPWSKLRQLVP